MSRRGRVASEAAVVAWFSALSVAWWWPLARHLGTVQVEPERIDSLFNEWVIGWGVHALTHYPARFFEANMYYPHPHVLAWGDNLFGVTLFALPLVPLVGLLAAYNVLLHLSTAAAGYCSYRLCRGLGVGRSAAIVAGMGWCLSYFRLTERSHIQILACCWIPLVFLAIERLRRPGQARPAYLRNVGFLVVSAWFVLATSIYLSLYTAVSVAVWVGVSALTRRLDRATFIRIVAGGALATAAALPLYLPSFLFQRRIHIVRSLQDQVSVSADQNLPWPPPGHYAGALARRVFGATFSVTRAHTVGIVVCALLVASVVWSVRHRRSPTARAIVPFVPYVAIAALAIPSSWGPTVMWTTRAVGTNPVFRVLYHVLPLYRLTRVPSRWFVVAGLGVLVFTAFVADRLLARASRRGLVVAVVVVAMFLLIEQGPMPLPLFPAETLAAHPIYRWLREQPGEFAILELPITREIGSGDAYEVEAPRIYMSTFHWKRRVNGAVSPTLDPDYVPLAELLTGLGADPPNPSALAWLRDHDVRYVLYHPRDQLRFTDQAGVEAIGNRLDANPGLAVVGRFADGAVYRVRRP